LPSRIKQRAQWKGGGDRRQNSLINGMLVVIGFMMTLYRRPKELMTLLLKTPESHALV
jgi:hypothetical protein